MMTYEMRKSDKNAERVRTYAARAAIAAGLALILAGFSFAAQSGIGLASRLADHQHTGAGDGAVLQGLAPVGNFVISGNNAGNIGISSSITGTNFIWKPASSTLVSGFASDDSFYVNNIGGYSWIGGYNTMSRGDYSLAFGTNVKNYRAASIALGYYLRNNAGNSVMIGSGPGFGGSAYAVNDDTGSIKFFPFTTTSETRPMLNMKRDNTAEVVGVWNFVSSPTINGVALSTAIGVDNTKVLKTGDTMTGPLTLSGSSLTVTGNAFSVGSGGNLFSVVSGSVAVGATAGTFRNKIYNTSQFVNDVTASNNYIGFYKDTVPNYVAAIGVSNPGVSSLESALIFSRYSGGWSEQMRINSTGNVGIGTTGPVSKLEISSGAVSITGSGAALNLGGVSQTVGYPGVAVSSTSQATGLVLPNGSSNFSVAVATTTATAKGGRPTLLLWVVSIANGGTTGHATCQMSLNGSAVTDSRRRLGIAAGEDDGSFSGHTLIPSSTAGVNTLMLHCNGDNASFTASTPHLTFIEY